MESVPYKKNYMKLYAQEELPKLLKLFDDSVADVKKRFETSRLEVVDVTRCFIYISEIFCLTSASRAREWTQRSLQMNKKDSFEFWPIVNYTGLFPYEMWSILFAEGVDSVGVPAQFLVEFDFNLGCPTYFIDHDVAHINAQRFELDESDLPRRRRTKFHSQRIIEALGDDASRDAREAFFFIVFVMNHEFKYLPPHYFASNVTNAELARNAENLRRAGYDIPPFTGSTDDDRDKYFETILVALLERTFGQFQEAT
jgi:hypothetical protein